MTVRELISNLQKYDLDSPVRLRVSRSSGEFIFEGDATYLYASGSPDSDSKTLLIVAS